MPNVNRTQRAGRRIIRRCPRLSKRQRKYIDMLIKMKKNQSERRKTRSKRRKTRSKRRVNINPRGGG